MRQIDMLKEQQQYTETLDLEICYSRLYSAYNTRNRNLMLKSITYYQNLFPLNILEIRDKITSEFLSHNLPQPSFLPWIQPTDYELELNVLGCMKTIDIQLGRLNYYTNNYTFATKILYETPQTFESEQVLYTESKGNLTVSNLLSVSKYAIKVAQTISPDNKNYDKANAAITVFQGIETTLNNKPEDKPTNKMLHLANDFLTTVVKANVEKKETKGGIVIASLLVDLAIDFFNENN